MLGSANPRAERNPLMSRLLVLALASPLALIGAMSPDSPGQPAPSAATPIPGPLTYRPCRPGPGDDRCIQLYERGVRAAYAEWQRERRGAPVRVAMGGPDEPAGHARHATPHPASRHDGHAGHANHADHADHAVDHRCADRTPEPADGQTEGM